VITLATFNGTDGQYPHGGLVMDGSGNLYGTTYGGGASGDGTVFELAKGSGTITTLASFNSTDGANPYGTLIMDSRGNLYGTTYSGGASGDGTVFEVANGSGAITTLASFSGANGVSPQGGVVMDNSGNLYGTTVQGGATWAGGVTGDGTVFELAHGSGTITTLASFDGTNGLYPIGELVLDGSGNLYGTTHGDDGTTSNGTVFEVANGSGAITTLASFNGTNGQGPSAGLLMDGSGNLYGTAFAGGPSRAGTVFEVVRGSGTITTLGAFNNTNGNSPMASLIMDSRGNLYGTAFAGGPNLEGTAFEVLQGSGTISPLAAFTGNGTDGANPIAGLIMDGSGNLYGTTNVGGGGLGTIFELPGAVLTTDQWTGANSSVDTNWSDPANWSIGSPPYPGQIAMFTKNATVQGFTAIVDAGFTNPIAGLEIDSTWGGTITVNSPLAVTGNFTLGSGSFGGSGTVSIAGTASQWTGGQLDLGAGGFANTGNLKMDTTGGNLVLTAAGTLTNTGTITEAGTHSLMLEKTATLSNSAGATFDLTDNGSIAQSGGGTFTNAGTLEKTGGTGTCRIATTTLDNTGTLAVTSGTVDISAGVTQVSGTTLTAGTWTVAGSATVQSKLDITSAVSFITLGSGARVTLSGRNSTFSNLKGLRTIDKGASFRLLGGQSFTTAGALADKGSLVLSPGSILTVGGSFTQASSGALTVEMGGTGSAPTFGELVSTSGTVTLAGSLKVTSTVVPAVGSSVELLDNEGNAAVSGLFKGLAEGATFKVKKGGTTMTFQITYAGTDADGNQNVLITRLS
jgi:uncharacterized repeat protein (TIGR03803 family)